MIDDGDASLVKASENATGHDKGWCVISKDLVTAFTSLPLA
jgi:hypothetical protein